MSEHVYARLAGHGWTLVPRAPFRFERVPNRPGVLLVEHRPADGPRRALLDFSRADPAVELGEGTSRLDEVLDFAAGPDTDHWCIETTVYSVRWPDGFAIQSAPDPPGFDLVGPNGTLIFLQGPFDPGHLPGLREMAGEGQRVHQIGESWVELDYLDEGQPWRQTHRLVPFGEDVLVVSFQAPVSWSGLVGAAAQGVAESVTPAG